MHRLLRQLGLAALSALGILSIIATGGSSDLPQLAPTPPPPPLSPAGIYVGQITSTATGLPIARSVSGVISETLDAQFFGTEWHYAGSVESNDAALTGSLTEYLGRQGRFFGVDGTQSVTLDGSIDETGLSGDYSGTDDEGRFNLSYLTLYERVSSPELPAGVWSFSLPAAGGSVYTISLTIGDSGEVFGTDTPGCVFSGQLSIIDADRNAYGATINIELCDQFNGDYAGLAYLSDFVGDENNQLTLAISNAEFAFSAQFSK